MSICTSCNRKKGYTSLGGLCPACHDKGLKPLPRDRSKDPPRRKSAPWAIRFLEGCCGLLFLIGLGLFLNAYDEYKVSFGVDRMPLDVSLEEIEAGNRPPTGFLRLGEHVRLYNLGFYVHSSRETNLPEDHHRPKYVLYPIVSKKHPCIAKSPDAAPTDPLPECNEFAVLVKTERFVELRQIPHLAQESGSVAGLIVTRASDLPLQAKGWIRDHFQGLNLDGVVILEEGRKPPSPRNWLLLLGGATACVLPATIWFIVYLRRERKN